MAWGCVATKIIDSIDSIDAFPETTMELNGMALDNNFTLQTGVSHVYIYI